MPHVVRVQESSGEDETTRRKYNIVNNQSGLTDQAIEEAMDALAVQYPPTSLYRVKNSSLQVVVMGYQISPEIKLVVKLLCSLNPSMHVCLDEQLLSLRPDEVEVINTFHVAVLPIPNGEVWKYAQ